MLKENDPGKKDASASIHSSVAKLLELVTSIGQGITEVQIANAKIEVIEKMDNGELDDANLRFLNDIVLGRAFDADELF